MTTFLLIPGAGCASWYWHRLEPELRARGHDVVAVDLPADDDSAGLAQYVDIREGRDPDAGFDVFTYFLHDVDPQVAESGAAHQREQSNTPFEQPWPFEAWPEVPTRAVIGSDDRLFPAAFQRRLLEDRLGVVPDELPGGHLVALVSPEALAERLDAYVTDLTRTSD